MARPAADAHPLKQLHPFVSLNKFLNYGAERDRTADLQSAILALSQLSYCPIQTVKSDVGIFHNSSQITALTTERVGFEPTVHMVDTRSPGVPIQPLSHLSRKQGDEWHETLFGHHCDPSLYTAVTNGEGGIRTHGTRRYNGFRDRPIQPLSHLSGAGVKAIKFQVSTRSGTFNRTTSTLHGLL